MIEIPLTRGYTAIIDDEDAHLAEMKWCATSSEPGVVYAIKKAPRNVGKDRNLWLHREVMRRPSGDQSIVDHIDGNGLNCRRSNLRVVTQSENMRNRGGPNTHCKSGFLGVYQRSYGWTAQIVSGGKKRHIGTFRTAEEANVGRLIYEMKVWGIQPRRREAFEAAGLIREGEAS